MNPAMVMKLLSCQPCCHFVKKSSHFWDFYALGSNRIKEFVVQLNNLHNSLCFIPFSSVFILQVNDSHSPSAFSEEIHWCWTSSACCRHIGMHSVTQSHTPEEDETKTSKYFSQNCFCSIPSRDRVWVLMCETQYCCFTATCVGSVPAELGLATKKSCISHRCEKLWFEQLGCTLLLGETWLPLLCAPWEVLNFLK